MSKQASTLRDWPERHGASRSLDMDTTSQLRCTGSYHHDTHVVFDLQLSKDKVSLGRIEQAQETRDTHEEERDRTRPPDVQPHRVVHLHIQLVDERMQPLHLLHATRQPFGPRHRAKTQKNGPSHSVS